MRNNFTSISISREADAFLKCSSLWSSTHNDYFSDSWKKKKLSILNFRASIILKKIFNQHSSFPEYIFRTVKQTERCITAQKTEVSSLQLSTINSAAHMGFYGYSIPSHLGRHTLYFKGTPSWKFLWICLDGLWHLCFYFSKRSCSKSHTSQYPPPEGNGQYAVILSEQETPPKCTYLFRWSCKHSGVSFRITFRLNVFLKQNTPEATRPSDKTPARGSLQFWN